MWFRYLERPLTVVGNRKFDIRAWVLLTADYRICMYREGVLRTAAVPYSLDDLSDESVHLSNHCIATKAGLVAATTVCGLGRVCVLWCLASGDAVPTRLPVPTPLSHCASAGR